MPEPHLPLSRPGALAALLLLLPPLPGQGGGTPASPAKKKLSFEEVLSGEASRLLRGRTPRVAWSPDGTKLSVRIGPGRPRWLDPRTGAEVPPPEGGKEGKKPTGARLALDLFAAREGLAKGRLRILEDLGERALGRHGNRLLFYRKGKGVRVLLEGAGVELPDLSPEGDHLAFVKGNDLHLCETGTGRVQVLTEGGGEDERHGKLDWVYQEEVYGRGRYKAHWWSPDSKHLAFLSLDTGEVPPFPIVDLLKAQPKALHERYPKPGEPNPKVRLRYLSVKDRRIRDVDLSGFPEDRLVVHVAFAPDGKRLLFAVQDRIQTWLELCAVDLGKTRARTLIREESGTWVPRPDMPRWLRDGSFLWLSHRTGFRHVYRYGKEGRLLKALTRGEWSVASLDHVDEAGGWLYFYGGKDGALDRNYYRGDLEGGPVSRLTPDPGWHQVFRSPGGGLLLDRFSSVRHPTRVRVLDLDGKVVREIAETEIPGLRTLALSKPELLRIPARDGHLLDASLTRPPDFDPGKPHPVWLPTYSGPGAPSLRNRWSLSAWDQFHAQQGFLVLRVNVRTASLTGHKFTGLCYKQLGVQELRDLEDAVDWLCRHPWADGERVGITGWSYGGFMAAYALTHSRKFRLGVAGAGVYDWRLYDSIYTERFMDLPSRNREGYDRTSCIKGAGDLSGHLLLLHGMDDDNVHLQNLVQFIDALQRADKDFEVMIYPGARHGLRGRGQNRSRRRLTWKAMKAHLLR